MNLTHHAILVDYGGYIVASRRMLGEWPGRHLNDTCGAEEISQVACMIKKLDEKLDRIIELVQGKLSFRHGKNPETVLD